VRYLEVRTTTLNQNGEPVGIMKRTADEEETATSQSTADTLPLRSLLSGCTKSGLVLNHRELLIGTRSKHWVPATSTGTCGLAIRGLLPAGSRKSYPCGTRTGGLRRSFLALRA
jgi:hypothetical protein